ncbi:WxL domain-containing protein [Vagococcus zengguangii]|uniref:WxL domain-containing protein n=1 Tax=Vagococcus zengguangii TaxID=2571750 RepID=UPI001107DAA0|nr:WxL domain-containing protein [Vagococcus zengguangii]TLG78272.1 WxL domain-containing protein [Vagococcus zengguangii]
MKKIYMSPIALLLFTAPVLSLAEEEKTYPAKGEVEFIPSTTVTPPVDPNEPDPGKPVEPWNPTDPDGKPEPGTTGPLSIDYASSFDFGVHEIVNIDQTYFAKAQYFFNADGEGKDESTTRPNYVQITDNRGTNAGWRLTVKQLAPFKNEDTINKELTGAKVTLTNSKADSNITLESQIPTVHDVTIEPGEDYLVMDATIGQGVGTWVDRWEGLTTVDGEQLNTGVQLFVPGATPRDAVQYYTDFLWTLSDIPANES